MANVLTDKDLEQINTNLEQLRIADDEAKQATAAGIDVSDLKQTIAAQREQLLKLKQAYFPGQ